MSRKQAEKYLEGIVEDERRYASFLTNSAFALIGANWVLLHTSNENAPIPIIGSLLAAVIYLFIRAVRHRFHLAHMREIVDNQWDKFAGATARGQNPLQTPYGKVSTALQHAELPTIILAASLFISAAITLLIKTF